MPSSNKATFKLNYEKLLKHLNLKRYGYTIGIEFILGYFWVVVGSLVC